ncbi:DUF6291 domain-containing protein [Agathobaculum sp. NTUH-O15-33]|uniref:DUF6291 domain-containing protein n=1 Tax=Agathobaculum sp. NTUH-O15-33 TaxID=3079302 RepID=UPI00295831BE|nr:DUF6291 domain-containing protein [Agathobaculum sp. NTUH-O15-33]WNX85945.1 DUF6291 domain-containing protein [Agathobaculum sp. NTUH-O15-33]
MAGRKAFMLYFDYREHLELLTDAERGALLTALFEYAEHGRESELAGAAKMAFSFIRAQLDRDADKYSERCERNRENGAKGRQAAARRRQAGETQNKRTVFREAQKT